VPALLSKIKNQDDTISALNKKVESLVDESASARQTMSALEAQMQALLKIVEK
jgi:uncharacterized coiled-coil protein SlyX